MPTFTIERTYDVPHFRHETYEAPDLETALKMDAENTEWEGQQACWDSCGDERVTGAWAGETAYEGDCLLAKSAAEIRDLARPRPCHPRLPRLPHHPPLRGRRRQGAGRLDQQHRRQRREQPCDLHEQRPQIRCAHHCARLSKKVLSTPAGLAAGATARQTMKKTVTIYTNRDSIDVQLPARWVICSHCEGSAKSSSYLGAFTASEWYEQDDDFKDDYMAGRYDRPCEPCSGLGRVQIIDAKACTGWRNRILLANYRRQQRDAREIDAIHAAERRMGA